MVDVYSFLQAVRDRHPLVHHITNWVTIGDCAQVVKSFGASPVMAHAREEVAEMTTLASSLVLNIGTLSTDIIDSMKIASLAANEKGIPVVLDVCGAGATSFRDRSSLLLLAETRISIIKGNGSEIARIAGLDVHTKGVDAAIEGHDLQRIAQSLAHERQCTVVITGKEDIVADIRRCFIIRNGHEMMSHVVGTGCMSTSAIGTFVGAVPERVTEAAVAGLVCYEVAAELAVFASRGPGSMRQHLFDCIYHLNGDDLVRRQRIEQTQ